MKNINEEKKTPFIKYGTCECCGCSLEPVWYLEEEYKTEHGNLYKTGRVRRAVDVLVCPHCLKKNCVDDTFYGPWYRP